MSETVRCKGEPVFEFAHGVVRLYNDQFEQTVEYPFDWHRSALATITERQGNQPLNLFRNWLRGVLCFRLNPFAMDRQAVGEDLYPNVNLSNIAAWYRHLVQADPGQNAALLASLREAIEAFRFLQFEPAGENVRLLVAEYAGKGGEAVKFRLNELSEGQRCLICLYTILHFVLAKGATVILDEPDNFVSLREIQPWLMAAAETIEDGQGQLLIISHHPEIIDQWAPAGGIQLIRDGVGPVRIEEFRGDPHSALPPSELVARGWEYE